MKVKYNFIITPTLSSLQHFLWTTPFSLDFSLIKDLNLFDCWYKYVYIYKNINTLLTAHNGNHLSAHPWERFFFSTLLRSQHSLFVGSSLSMVEAPSFPHFLVTCWLESSLFMSCLVSNTDKTLVGVLEIQSHSTLPVFIMTESKSGEMAPLCKGDAEEVN